jgi:hypothetical protein
MGGTNNKVKYRNRFVPFQSSTCYINVHVTKYSTNKTKSVKQARY